MVAILSSEQRKFFVILKVWKIRQFREEFQIDISTYATYHSKERKVWSRCNCSECPQQMFWKTLNINEAHKLKKKNTRNISPEFKKTCVASKSWNRNLKIKHPLSDEVLSLEKLHSKNSRCSQWRWSRLKSEVFAIVTRQDVWWTCS